MGFWCVVLMWPFIIFLHYLGWETWELPSWEIFGSLMANALLGTKIKILKLQKKNVDKNFCTNLGSALSDWLWLRSVLLLSAVVATLGLSLTIPVCCFLLIPKIFLKIIFLYLFRLQWFLIL